MARLGSFSFNFWALMCTVAIVVLSIQLALAIWRSKLRVFPGPVLASITDGYLLVKVSTGKCHIFFNDLHATYGPVVRVGPNKLSIADPEAVPVIYGTSTKFLKSTFYEAFRRNVSGHLADNIFTTQDPNYHKMLKSSAASTYSLSSLRRMEELIDQNTQLFVQAMHEKGGVAIDLGCWLQWYAFDVVGSITFLQTFGFMEAQGDPQNIIAGLDVGFKYASMVGTVPWVHRWLLGSSTGTKILSYIPTFARANIGPMIGAMALKAMSEYDARAYDEKSDSADLLSALRQAQAKHPDRLADKDVMGFILANLVAGSDTTAIALRTIFYNLVQHPKIYEKLMKEIEEKDEAGRLSPTITYSEGLDLPYLQAVIKESLRLHPGVSLPLERVVPPEGANICHQFIPGGTIVGINAWVVHRDKLVYGVDADSFRPDRWLEADQEQLRLMNRAFLAFGGGSRSCIGKNISILEMTKFIPQVLRRFKVEWAGPRNGWVIESHFMAKQKGMIMKLIPYDRQPQ